MTTFIRVALKRKCSRCQEREGNLIKVAELEISQMWSMCAAAAFAEHVCFESLKDILLAGQIINYSCESLLSSVARRTRFNNEGGGGFIFTHMFLFFFFLSAIH